MSFPPAFKAMHPRQSPDLRGALADAQRTGVPLQGLFAGIDSVQCIKLAADIGFGIVCVDVEHSCFSGSSMVEHVQAINFHSRGKSCPMVRIPHIESEQLCWALDAGAGGVMLPHTETAEQARSLVAKCLFPPQGHRSAPPLAWMAPFHTESKPGVTLLDQTNASVAPIVQIESVLGVKNAEEILSVPGVAGCMIGIGDLRVDGGWDGIVFGRSPSLYEGPENAECLKAVQHVSDVCQKYKVPLFLVGAGATTERLMSFKPSVLWAAVDGWGYMMGLTSALQASQTNVALHLEQHKAGSKSKAVNGERLSQGGVNGASS